MALSPARRCAVYTRKSSEEGLEQDFNSLQAQREACEAFIASQRGEGWKLVPTAYDDGGISGGTMERPALQRLLSDIQSGAVDIVVVYKVDRLTRSLADFAKMVEVFDGRGVSFVAVTQQFNTTTSMGRLTLNVLLSFAQFEREVTGERIRDKIAASKKKGMWMGGMVPLGYKAQDRKLVPVAEEAERVRFIYQRYLNASGVRELAGLLRKEGVRPKEREGQPLTHFSRGALYVLLSNPLYIGQIRHKGVCHPGLHPGIVDPAIWAQAQEKLKATSVREGIRNRKTESSPLMGKLVDELGNTLTPSHAVKRGRRYRYYVSRPVTGESKQAYWRLPASEIEQRVEQIVAETLNDQNALTEAALRAGVPDGSIERVLELARGIGCRLALVDEVKLSRTELKISMRLPSEPVIHLERPVAIQMRRRGVESKLVIPGEQPPDRGQSDPALVKVIGRALKWWDQVSSGQMKILDIARQEGIHKRYVQKVMPLAFLAPDVVESIVRGRQPVDLTAEALIKRIEMPLSWDAQRVALGFT